MALAATVGAALPAAAQFGLDWQPGRAAAEPWRWWTAIAVHYGPAHLGANLAGCAFVAAFGAAARLHWRWTGAWLVAWPLGHLTLLLAPGPLPAHYGGLSGTLHAGVAVGAVALLAERSPPSQRVAPGQDPPDPRARRRGIGAAVLAGLAIKLWLEQNGAGPGAVLPGSGVPIATAAHASGALCGIACAGLVALLERAGVTMHR